MYVGTNTAGEKIRVSSKTEKHVPIYNLTVETWGKGGGKSKKKTIKKPFSKWFDKQGRFVVLPFQQMVATGVEVVGRLDPAKVVEKKEKPARVEDANKTMDDKWASLLAESEGVGSGAGGEEATPRTKRRGKKAA